MKYQLKDCVTYLKDNAEHVTYGILLLGLLLVFWSPVAIYQVDAFSGPMFYVWRGITALFLWIIFLLPLLLFAKTRQAVIHSFLSLSLWIRCLIVVFFIIGIVSAVFAFSQSTAFKGLAIDIAMLMGVLFLANYFSRFAQNVRWLLVVVVICAISYVVLLFMNLALVSGINEPTSIILQTQRDLLRQFNFANPRFFDHFASWFLPLLTLPFLAKNYSFRFKFFVFLAMMSLWFVIIAHSSRALILEYIVIAIVLGVLNRKWLLRFFTWQLFAVICAVVLFYIVQLFIPAESVVQRSLLANSDRMLLWSKSIALGFNHLLLGVGELNALYYLRDYPHNIVLTVFVQWGVFGLVIFLLVALRSFIKSCELMKINKDSALYFVSFCGVLAAMTHAMLSNLFKLPLSQLSLIFMCGLLLSFMPKTKEMDQKKHHLILVVLVVILILILLTLPFLGNAAI